MSLVEIEVTAPSGSTQALVRWMKPRVIIQIGDGLNELMPVAQFVAAASRTLAEGKKKKQPLPAAVGALGLILAALQRLHETGEWGDPKSDRAVVLDMWLDAVPMCPFLTGEMAQILMNKVWMCFLAEKAAPLWVSQKIIAEISRLRELADAG